MEKPLFVLFKQGEMLEFTHSLFKVYKESFEKIQSSSDGLVRALLLVEVLGSIQKLNI